MVAKGQFFSFDAFLALSLFIIATVLLFSFFAVKAPLTQQFYYADDITNLFANTRINELFERNFFITNERYNYPKDAQDYDDGKTVNEVLRNMQIYGNVDSAKNLVEDLLKGLLPEKYGFSFGIESGICQGNDCLIVPGTGQSNFIVSREKFLRG